MVTKLRNFSTNKLTKAVAFIVLVSLMVSVITQLLIATYKNYNFETVFSEKYIQSDAYLADVNTAINSLANALTVRDSNAVRLNAGEVRKGMGYVNEDIAKIDYFDDFAAGKEYIDKTLKGDIDLDELDEYKDCTKYIIMYRDFIAGIIENRIEMYGDYGNKDSEIYYIRAYRDYINDIMAYKSAIDYDISDRILNDYGYLRFYYYAANGEQTYSNVNFTVKEDFAQLADETYFHEDGIWEKSDGALSDEFYNQGWWYDHNQFTIYLAFTNASISEIQAQWDAARNYSLIYFISTICQIAAGVIIFIYLMIVTGRRPGDKKLHLRKTDNIFSDILLAAECIIISIMFTVWNEARYFVRNQIFILIFAGAAVAVCCLACVYIALSLVRKIKAGKLLKHSLTYIVLFGIYDFFRSIFDGRRFEKYPLTKSLFYRQVIFISTCAALVFFTVIFAVEGTGAVLIPMIIGVAVIYWYITGNNKTFAEINKGFNESLEEQMRAERMKIALVTNVSHDLKTPLTSIISYVELLSKEFNEQNFTNINDYINILAEKSDRLKHIVSDLFDIAKSTSGDIELELETLDAVKLVEQTLADMSDKIENSALQFKVKMPDEPIFVRSDGKKMYRILQNVIDNAIKYSLNGTRVFVELTNENSEAVISVKNTSAYEMDFTAEEVLARFTRGDKSRSTEGSGLGLSIAESFVYACGGKFNVVIDGDQFKVMIALPKSYDA